MRLLHLIPSLSGGGAERQLSLLAPEFVRRGHTVHVAFTSGAGREADLAAAGVELHPLRCRSNYDPKLAYYLLRLIRHIEPDLIHTWILQMDIIGGLVAMTHRIPWVLGEPTNRDGHPEVLKSFLRRVVGASAAAIIANSPGGVAYWASQSFPRKRVIITNAVALSEIARARAPAAALWGIDSVLRIVLYAGRFDRIKNIWNLLAALERVLIDPTVAAILCGDGPELKSAKQWIDSRGLTSRIICPGFVTDVWPIMKRADVFVSVSQFEGQPNAVLEAMACGCPLVVSDIAAHRAFLDEHCALFVDLNDAEVIADAITASLRDVAGSRERARLALKETTGWSVSAIAVEFEKVYAAVLERAERGRRLFERGG